MSGNISLLTVVFIVCYFIAKGRNEVVYTTITRDLNKDYFTNPWGCKDCYEYGAVQEQGQSGRVCRCEDLIKGSLFLRSEKHCTDEGKFRLDEGCEPWKNEHIVLIDTDKTDSRYIFYEGKYKSCYLESFISYLNGTTGEWQLFNSSGNVFVMENDPDTRSSQIKVTPLSSSRLRKFKGYVMKLGLNCINTQDRKRKDLCLLFKAKGDIRFPLNCSLPPTTSPPTTTTTITTTTTTPTTGSSTPTITTTPSEPDHEDTDGIIVAIAISGTVLCVSLICAFAMVLYRYTHICKSRGHQARNAGNAFDGVISNPGPQSYRIQEEPLYVEVPDIYPCDKGSVGISTKRREERPSVFLNPYVNEAVFSAGRQNRPPLPSRPELDERIRTPIDTVGPPCQNGGCKAIGEETDGSVVLTNPKVEEDSLKSLPRSENNFTKLSDAREQDEESIGHHHHHHDGEHGIDNDTVRPESEGAGEGVYHGLMKETRAQSVFVCPSCNDNPVYQRLSMPRHCPHGAKGKKKENRTPSFYASLRELESGSRESVYANPSCIAEEPAAEDKNRNSEEGEGLPEYQILEPEEPVSNEDPDEPVNHDYNVLEGPEETCDEADEHTNGKIDPEPTSEDPNLPIEQSDSLNMEDNPRDTEPWKIKEGSDLPIEPSEFLNIEDNPAYAKPLKTKDDPELLLEASEFRNVEDNPAYAKPWKTIEDPDFPIEPSEFFNLENNPTYAKPFRAKTSEPRVRRRTYSM